MAAPTEPPADLLSDIFPWVEQQQAALEARTSSSKLSRDIALKQFLRLLAWLRVVVLQDCALIYAKHPECPLFRFAPFTYLSFKMFSANATANLAAAEEKARLTFQNLPDHVAQSMQGYTTNLHIDQQQNHKEILQQISNLQESNAQLQLMVMGSKRRIKTGNYHFNHSGLLLPLMHPQ